MFVGINIRTHNKYSPILHISLPDHNHNQLLYIHCDLFLWFKDGSEISEPSPLLES